MTESPFTHTHTHTKSIKNKPFISQTKETKQNKGNIICMKIWKGYKRSEDRTMRKRRSRETLLVLCRWRVRALDLGRVAAAACLLLLGFYFLFVTWTGESKAKPIGLPNPKNCFFNFVTILFTYLSIVLVSSSFLFINPKLFLSLLILNSGKILKTGFNKK
jgi:hypothetical protein